ncbi:MAG: lipid A biosynthesis acyltransferase [Burkholderiales bacterium]
MLTRLAVGLLWLLRFLPLPLLALIGAGLGRLGYHLIHERRRVCLTNLAKCFPDMPEHERVALAKRHFAAVGQALFDHGILFWSSARRIKRLVRIVNPERFAESLSKPTILLAPHFVGLDAGATRLSIESEAVSMYANQKDPFINDLLRRHRSRFKPVRLFSRQDGIRPVIREMRKCLPFYYLPDQDYGPRDSVFVPFFGVSAATITGVSRVAQLAHAQVVPAVTRMLPGGRGYEVRVYPAWKDFPSGDLEADARRMNAFIEERILEMPEQYNWMHKRFKTRPPGEARFY